MKKKSTQKILNAGAKNLNTSMMRNGSAPISELSTILAWPLKWVMIYGRRLQSLLSPTLSRLCAQKCIERLIGQEVLRIKPRKPSGKKSERSNAQSYSVYLNEPSLKDRLIDTGWMS